MSDYPMLISNKLHSFRNFILQRYKHYILNQKKSEKKFHGIAKKMKEPGNGCSAWSSPGSVL